MYYVSMQHSGGFLAQCRTFLGETIFSTLSTSLAATPAQVDTNAPAEHLAFIPKPERHRDASVASHNWITQHTFLSVSFHHGGPAVSH